jgi:hypothetical protein
MKNKLYAFVLLIFVSGCTPILKLFYGLRESKAEDSTSITSYYNRKGIDTDNILVFSDSVKYYERFNEVKDIPQIRVFNKEGYLIYYKDTAKACSAPAYKFTESICSESGLTFNVSKDLKSETNGLLELNSSPFHPTDMVYDYYVFIYSARFVGHLNKNPLKIWEHSLKNAKGCKVKYYLVDMDWQKSWDK